MTGARPVGQRRSRRFVCYWEVPHGTPEERIPHDRYLAKYLEAMSKDGWVLEGVLRRWKEPYTTISGKDISDVYNTEVLLSRPLRSYTFEVPDELVPKILADKRIGPLVTNVS